MLFNAPCVRTPRRMSRVPRAFTLIELLVVVAIIALLLSILLPSMGGAREAARASVCGSNMRQLAIAANTYANDHQDWLNPLEDFYTCSDGSPEPELTFRYFLFPYVSNMPQTFDCPSERKYRYADGFSQADEARARSLGETPTDPELWSRMYGIPHKLERWNLGGIGIAGVHWIRKSLPADQLVTRAKVLPFGRPTERKKYVEGMKKMTDIQSPGRLIWFGDGASDDTLSTWGSDNGWWIKSQAAGHLQDLPGFNRLQQNDYGCQRHNRKANYAFADGHVNKLHANEIPCAPGMCWWSTRPDVHPLTTTAR